MPYRRVIHLQTPLVEWHDVTLLERQPDWSESYRAPTPRLLIPRNGWLHCETDHHRGVFDAVRPLWLMPDMPYRIRQPCTGQRSVLAVFSEVPPQTADRLTTSSLLALAHLGAVIESGKADTLQVEETLLAAVQPPTSETSPSRHQRARRAVLLAQEFIASHPSGSHSLSDVAAACHVSPFHLARLFRSSTGLSLHAYRTRLRMALALDLLRQPHSSLSEIALDLGYSSHSHFSAVFHRHFACAPSEVRTNLIAASQS